MLRAKKIEHYKTKYKNILFQLLTYFNKSEIKALETCSKALNEKLNSQDHSKLSDKKVLIAYGGGKDSSFMLAYIRIIQLLTLINLGETFKIRISTNRQMGMVQAVMENIHKVYEALGLYNDQLVEMFLIDAQEIVPFNKDLPISYAVKKMNRKEVLMSGHLSQGDGRPTFCNACNLSMVNSFAIAAWYQKGVDVIITGDSKKELRDYYIWVKRLSSHLGNNSTKSRGFQEFLKKINFISNKYFEEIFGNNAVEEIKKRTLNFNNFELSEPNFFSIYDYTSYNAGDHWELLTSFLGFKFDDLAFNFSETDCANPALMAHLRGLKSEHLYQRKYEDGIQDYLSLAIQLMKNKNFPEHLVEQAKARYLEIGGIQKMRTKMEYYAKQAFDLSEEQLVCMVYSPFVEQGSRLELYLEHEQPALKNLLPEIHSILNNESEFTNKTLIEKLCYISGLTLNEMKILYHGTSLQIHNDQSVVSLILRDDPHKKIIEVKHNETGDIVKELISGR